MIEDSEEWRPVVGYEGLYEVSDRGRVKSLKRRCRTMGNAYRTVPERILKTHLNGPPPTRYLRVSLHRDGVQGYGKVHLLVLAAFVGPRPEGLVGCHGDGNALNNHVSNLRWDTYSGNALDAVRHGTHAAASKTHCSRSHEFTPENTGVNSGRRRCLKCHSENQSARYRRKLSALTGG